MADTENGKTKRYEVTRPARPVHWETDVPGSKSITNRALLLAALTDGTVRLENVQLSDDSRVFIEALRELGFSVFTDETERSVTVEGCGGRIPLSGAEIYVGSAGTAARFLTAMLGMSDGIYRIEASEQMMKRPMRPLFEALFSLGAHIKWLGEEWHLSVELTGAAVMSEKAGPPDPVPEGSDSREVCLDISQSTQFLSALLMAAPMLPGGLSIHLTGGKKGGPYVDMTRQMMDRFGVETFSEDSMCGEKRDYSVPSGAAYSGTESYRVEPDVSAACYFYAAAAVTGGTVRVNGVLPDGLQGDIKFLGVLEKMGCTVEKSPLGLTVTGPANGKLHGISVDMRDFSDQALTLAAIAPYADGPVEITDIAHVRKQESDRIGAITVNLKRAGISCEERPDGVRIEPGQPQPCVIDTFDDHRVAMAFAVMGLGADGIVIDHPGCCAKTFPDFFIRLDELIKEV